MTTDEATRIVRYLNAAFPAGALDGDSLAVFVEQVALLHDHTIGATVARRIVQESQRFPTIAEFRRTYRSVAEAVRAAAAALPPAALGARPRWTYVWQWAHFHRNPPEERLFPSEQGFNAEESRLEQNACRFPRLTDEEYHVLELEWLSIGAPKYGIQGIFGLVDVAEADVDA